MAAAKIAASTGASAARYGRSAGVSLIARLLLRYPLPLRERVSSHRLSSHSSRDLPGGAVLGVLDGDAHRGELVADAIGLLEVFSRTRGGAIGNQRVDAIGIDAACAALAGFPMRGALGQESQKTQRSGKGR